MENEMENMDALRQIWDQMCTPDSAEYKLLVFRLEPVTCKGLKIAGYLRTFHLPVTIPDIIEKIGIEFGGGKFQIRIVDGTGKYIKSKMFEIAGFPLLPKDALEPNPSYQIPPQVTATALADVPIPTKEEVKDLIIRRTLMLLDKPGANELEALKFLKELYRGVK